MEEIIIIVISFIGELFIESLLYFPWDIFMVSYEKRREGNINKFGWSFASLLVGMLIGWISVLLFSSAMLPFSWLRVVNLIVAPLIAGSLALRLSKRRNKKSLSSDDKFHYLIAFLFTLGLIGIRLLLTTKN